VEADLIEHLAEVDARRLYAREAAPSMFAYCTEVLHLSEAEAYLRITAARAARSHPALSSLLRDGRLHLSAIALLAPHLTPANARDLLERSAHKTKRQVQELLAAMSPRPDAPTFVRRLPERTPDDASRLAQSSEPAAGPDAGARVASEQHTATPNSPDELRPDRVAVASLAAPVVPLIEPLAPGRYKVQFTASKELYNKLERLRSLSRAVVPDGDLATLIDMAVTEKLQRLEARRFGAAGRPRSMAECPAHTAGSRRVPAAVRRAVIQRDGQRCGFVAANGRSCSERDHLEYHHRHPWAMGGDHDTKNIGLLCRTHNAWVAEQDYGRRQTRRGEG
jgi:hypothetical protein